MPGSVSAQSVESMVSDTCPHVERYFENDMPGGRANPLPFNRFRPHANGGFTMRESIDHNREVIGKSGETVFMILLCVCV